MKLEKTEILKFAELLDKKKKIIILGSQNSGKTFLGSVPIFLDVYQNFVWCAGEQLNIDKQIFLFTPNFSEKPSLLFIDEFDKVTDEKVLNTIISLLKANHGSLHIIITTRECEFYKRISKFAHTYVMPRMSLKFARELFQCYDRITNRAYPAAVKSFFWDDIRKNPSQVLKYCFIMINNHAETKNKKESIFLSKNRGFNISIDTIDDLLKEIQKKGLEAISNTEPLNHSPMVGNMYEGLTSELLQKSLFKRFDLKVRSGKIRGRKGTLSCQIDCMLVIGNGEQIPFTDNFIYDVSNVIAVIEVKKLLNKNEILRAFNTLSSVSKLCFGDVEVPVPTYKLIMAEDAYSQIMHKKYRNDDEDKRLPNSLIYSSIVFDIEAPLRVIWAYEGYKTSLGLRNSFKKTINELEINGRLFIHYFPNLVICAENTLIKLNGLPYGEKYDPNYFNWVFTASENGQAMVNFLNILWYRLCHKFDLDYDFIASGKIQYRNKWLTARFEFEPGVNDSPVVVLQEVLYNRTELKATSVEIKWEPIKVSIHAGILLYFMADGGKLVLTKDFAKDIKALFPKWRKLFIEIGLTEEIEILEKEPDVANVVTELFKTGLVWIYEKMTFEMIHHRCMILHTKGNFYVGENRDGRFHTWMDRYFEAEKRDKDDGIMNTKTKAIKILRKNTFR